MRKEIIRYLPEITVPATNKTNPVLLRVILSEEQTQLDFGYAALSIYVNGGWIRISPETYLQLGSNGKRYPLKGVKNIALAPEQVEFESRTDWCVFSLFFEPIPIADCVLHMIEAEKPDPNDFNYYNIALRNTKKTTVVAWALA